jgi:hypothetical protein
MQVDNSLSIFMNYSFDRSAKESGKLLAIEMGELKEIDLKTASFCTRLSLWWNGSLKLEKIGALVRESEAMWHRELSGASGKQAQLERQCAHLARKMVRHDPKTQYRSSFEWLLTGKIYYQTSDSPLQVKEVAYSFDRLSTNWRIQQRILQESGELNVLGRKFHAHLAPLFATHAYSGDYLGEACQCPFLKESEAGQNRTFTLTFKEPQQRELGDQLAFFILQERLRAYREANRGVIEIPTSVRF